MNRIQLITGALTQKGIDGILVCDLKNVRYLSGFRGSSAYLIITRKNRFFFTDFRYQEQAQAEVRGYDVLIENDDMPAGLMERARKAGIKTLGFEASVHYSFYRSLLRKGVRLKAVNGIVEDLRKVKDAFELKLIAKAVERAQKAYTDLRPYIKNGVSEKSLALRLEEFLKKRGCNSLPFDIIVASGKNSSMPHARPSDRKLRAGDLVVIDWGGEAEGYFSDMTRTVLMKGGPLSKKMEIYEAVLRANLKAIDSVSAGVHARTVDKTARDVIKRAGYAGYFGHGTGHGVGLEVHERPRISRLGRESIKKGMVFTIEPGIYVPGLGGVRIEDMVLAGADGCKVLTDLPKHFEIIN